MKKLRWEFQESLTWRKWSSRCSKRVNFKWWVARLREWRLPLTQLSWICMARDPTLTMNRSLTSDSKRLLMRKWVRPRSLICMEMALNQDPCRLFKRGKLTHLSKLNRVRDLVVLEACHQAFRCSRINPWSSSESKIREIRLPVPSKKVVTG